MVVRAGDKRKACPFSVGDDGEEARGVQEVHCFAGEGEDFSGQALVARGGGYAGHCRRLACDADAVIGGTQWTKRGGREAGI